jgi:Pyridine nucleotide-disulphide oxidoreductase
LRAGPILDLVVVGAGPTGIAALLHARRLGLQAVAIDPGGPLAQLRRYPDQLIFVSPSHDFEVASIPLDCRSAAQVTREEVLSYYERLVAWEGLEVRPARCRALQPDPGGVRVVVDGLRGGGPLRTRSVLFTAWYEPRPLPEAMRDPCGVVPTYASQREMADCRAQHVAVLGGGLSAFEHAVAQMMAGRQVSIVARGRLDGPFRKPAFHTLAAATDSRAYEQVADLRVTAAGVTGCSPQGPLCLPCGAVIACLGTRVSPQALRLLLRAGALSASEAQALEQGPHPEELLRAGLAGDERQAVEMALARWPDLLGLLVEGRRRIHAAGGALHVGGSRAGVRISIETARLAVHSLAGGQARPTIEGPLPEYLFRWGLEPLPESPPFEALAPLRPLPVQSWTRTGLVVGGEDPSGFLSAPRERSDPLRYLLGPRPPARLLQGLLGGLDGRTSVGGLAARNGFDSGPLRASLAKILYYLMRHNALTWLPPPRGPAGVNRLDEARVPTVTTF